MDAEVTDVSIEDMTIGVVTLPVKEEKSLSKFLDLLHEYRMCRIHKLVLLDYFGDFVDESKLSDIRTEYEIGEVVKKNVN